jgi:hypothetical protein
LAVVYRKTEKGKLVSPTKTFGLPWPVRFALMQVNDRRTDADLRSTLGPRFEDSVQTLIGSGFIESVPDELATAKTIDIKQAQRLAVRWLTDKLGPLAEHASLKIERTKNSAELAAALQLARRTLQAQMGELQAQRFDREVIDPLGGPLIG